MDFLAQRLPVEVFQILASQIMMPLSTRLKATWLDDVVSASTEELSGFQVAQEEVSKFIADMNDLQVPDLQDLREWVANGSKIWLTKRREWCLDITRNELAAGKYLLGNRNTSEENAGLGEAQVAEHIESRLLDAVDSAHVEPAEDAATDWDNGWGSGDDEDNKPVMNTQKTDVAMGEDEENADDADAWGWGDDEATDVASPTSPSKAASALPKAVSRPGRKEVCLRENYMSSSIPGPLLATIIRLYEDADKLSKQGSAYIRGNSQTQLIIA